MKKEYDILKKIYFLLQGNVEFWLFLKRLPHKVTKAKTIKYSRSLVAAKKQIQMRNLKKKQAFACKQLAKFATPRKSNRNHNSPRSTMC